MNAIAPARPDHSWWREALKGNRLDYPDKAPRPGYFRHKQRAVAFWYDEDGVLTCGASSGFEPEDPDEITDLFATACLYPIDYATYEKVCNGEDFPPHYVVDLTLEEIQAGTAWTPAFAKRTFDERQAKARVKQDEAARQRAEAARVIEAKDVTAALAQERAANPSLGHNSGAEHDMVRDELNAILTGFRKWFYEELAGKIDSEADSLRAKGYQEQALAIQKKATAKHKAEKEPHLVACREVDARWISGETSIKAQAETLKNLIVDARTPFEREQQRQKDEVARLAKAAEDKRRIEEQGRQQALAAKGQADMPQPLFEALPAMPKPAAGKPPPKSTREVKTLVIDDFDAVLSLLARVPAFRVDITDILNRHARRQLENGVAVPGARIVLEHVAK